LETTEFYFRDVVRYAYLYDIPILGQKLS